MKRLALTIGALAAVGAVGLLIFWGPGSESSPAQTPAEPSSAGVAASGEDAAAAGSANAGQDAGHDADDGSAQPASGGTDGQGEAAVPPVATDTKPSGESGESPESADSGKGFQHTIDGLVAKGDKAAFGELLGEWRTGALPREQELAIDRALSTLDGPQLDELDKAAGRLLLEVPQNPERRRALASLLASSGSQLGARFLVEAAATSELRAQALETLSTISDPEVLPVYRQQINANASPDLLTAIANSLRQMDTPKARELEQQINALRD